MAPSCPLPPLAWRTAVPCAALLVLLIGCAGPRSSTPQVDPRLATEAGDILTQGRVHAKSMGSAALFEAWSSRVASERYVRFLINVHTGGITYFDSNIYPLHLDFVFSEIYRTELTPEALDAFMLNYEATKPDFIFGYLVHHLAQDLWTWAHWEGDTLRTEHLRAVWTALKSSFFKGAEVHFRPDSDHHEAVAEPLSQVPVLTNDTLYGEATYQLFNVGERVGRLVIIRESRKALTAERGDILILHTAVPDVAVVAGMISETFSTPLSHVALRARAWGIPHIGQKNASELYKHLEGQIVYFAAEGTEHTLRKATEAEIARLEGANSHRREVVMPPVDLSRKELLPLSALGAVDAPAYGAKSANLGAIAARRMDGFVVPPGFGIPVAWYDEHMKRHGLDRQVREMLQDPRFLEDPEVRADQLARLRAAIEEAPLERALTRAVSQIVSRLEIGQGRGLAVRSSTNAEDLPGFSGAGIYDSFLNVRGPEALSRAIRDVWASVWNQRAYEERSFYGIDHQAVFGAVLVQEAIDATAAGVMVTTNMYKPAERHVFTINAKSGLGIRVVNGHKLPEQLLFDTEQGTSKVISRSDEDTMLVFDDSGGVQEVANPQRGEAVLTEGRVRTLVDGGLKLRELFAWEDPLDIEWLFVKDDLYIVQARPYVTN